MWTDNRTWAGRYDELGISCIISSHSDRLGSNSLRVIDVGCSKGAATYDCQQILANRSIKIETIGIDQSPKIRKDAEKNLDQFILSNVLCVENHIGNADVVICANMLRWGVTPLERCQVIKKCAGFLNPTGILIMASPIPKGFGRRPEKGEADICNPTNKRKLLRAALHLGGIPRLDMVNEIRILNKAECSRLAKHMCK